MWKLITDIFSVVYNDFKKEHKGEIVAIVGGLFVVAIFLLGWMVSRWPKGQWPRRK